MKPYVYTILLLLLIATACRSNRSTDKVSQALSEAGSTVSVHERDSAASQSHRKDSMSDITTEKQYIRTTWYRPDGTIRKVQEEGRDTRQEKLAVSHSGSSDVSVSEKKTDSTSLFRKQSYETLHEITKSDSRLIQGSEWFWVCLVVALVLAIIVIRNKDRIIKFFK